MDPGFVPIDPWNPESNGGNQAQSKPFEASCGPEQLHAPQDACARIENNPPMLANGVRRKDPNHNEQQHDQQLQDFVGAEAPQEGRQLQQAQCSDSSPSAALGAHGLDGGNPVQHGAEVAQEHPPWGAAAAIGGQQRITEEARPHGAAPMDIDEASTRAPGACEAPAGTCEAATPLGRCAEDIRCVVKAHTVIERGTLGMGNVAATTHACSLFRSTENTSHGGASAEGQREVDNQQQPQQQQQQPQQEQQQQLQEQQQPVSWQRLIGEEQVRQEMLPLQQAVLQPQNRPPSEQRTEQQLHAPAEQQNQIEQQQQPEQQQQAKQQLLTPGEQQQQTEQGEQQQQTEQQEQAEQQLLAAGKQQQQTGQGEQQKQPEQQQQAAQQLHTPGEQQQQTGQQQQQTEQQLQAPGEQQKQTEQQQEQAAQQQQAAQQLQAPGEQQKQTEQQQQQQQAAQQLQARGEQQQHTEQQQQVVQQRQAEVQPQAESQQLAEQQQQTAQQLIAPGEQQQQTKQQQQQQQPEQQQQAEKQFQAPGVQQEQPEQQQQQQAAQQLHAPRKQQQHTEQQQQEQQQTEQQQKQTEQQQQAEQQQRQTEQQQQQPQTEQQQQAEQHLQAPGEQQQHTEQQQQQQTEQQQQQTEQQQQQTEQQQQAEQHLQAQRGQHQFGAAQFAEPGTDQRRDAGSPQRQPLPPPKECLQQPQQHAAGEGHLVRAQQQATGEHLQQLQQQAEREQQLQQPQQRAEGEQQLQQPQQRAEGEQQVQQLQQQAEVEQHVQQPQQHAPGEEPKEGVVHGLQDPQNQQPQRSSHGVLQQAQQHHTEKQQQPCGQQPQQSQPQQLAAQPQPAKEQCQIEEQQAQHTKREQCQELHQQRQPQLPPEASGLTAQAGLVEARVTILPPVTEATPAGGDECCAAAAATAATPQHTDSPCLSISVSGLEAGEILPDADATSWHNAQGVSSRRRSEEGEVKHREGAAGKSERVRKDEERHRGVKGVSMHERRGKSSMSRGPASGEDGDKKDGRGRAERASGGSSSGRDNASVRGGDCVPSRDRRQVEGSERSVHRVSMERQRSQEVGAREQQQHREREREGGEGSRQKPEGQRGSGQGPPVILELKPIEDESGGRVAVAIRVSSYALTLSELRQRGGHGGRDEGPEGQREREREGARLHGREKAAEQERGVRHTVGASHYGKRGRSSPVHPREWERSRSRSLSRHTPPPASGPLAAQDRLPPRMLQARGPAEREHRLPTTKLSVRSLRAEVEEREREWAEREWRKRDELEHRKEREEWERERRERELAWRLKHIEAQERDRAWKSAQAAAEAARRRELLREQQLEEAELERERERERERGRTLSARPRAREHERSLSRMRGSPPPSAAHRLPAGVPRGRSRDRVRACSPPPPVSARAPLMVPPMRGKAAYAAVPDPVDLRDPLPPPRGMGRHFLPEPRPRSRSPPSPYPRPMPPAYMSGHDRGRVLPMGAMPPPDYDPFVPPPLPCRPYARMDPYDDPFIDDDLYGPAPRGHEMLRRPPSPLRPLPRRSRSRSPPPSAPQPHAAPPRMHSRSRALYPPPEDEHYLTSRGGGGSSSSSRAYDAALPRRPTSTPADPSPRGYLDPSIMSPRGGPNRRSTAYAEPRTFSPPRDTRAIAYVEPRVFSPPQGARAAAYAEPPLSPRRARATAYAEPPLSPRRPRVGAYAGPPSSPPRRARSALSPPPARSVSPPPRARAVATGSCLPPPPPYAPAAELDPMYDRLPAPRNTHIPYGYPPFARQHPMPARHKELEPEERGGGYSRGRSAAMLPPRGVTDGAISWNPIQPPGPREYAPDEVPKHRNRSGYNAQLPLPPRSPGYYLDSSRGRRPFSPPPRALPDYGPPMPRGSRMPPSPPPRLPPPPLQPMDRGGGSRPSNTHTRGSYGSRPRSPPPPVDDGRPAKRSHMDPMAEGNAREPHMFARIPVHPSRAPAPAFNRAPIGLRANTGGGPEAGGGDWRARPGQPRMPPPTSHGLRQDAAPAAAVEPCAIGRGMMTGTVYDLNLNGGRSAGANGGSRAGGYGPPLPHGGAMLPSSHMRGGGGGGPGRPPIAPSAAMFDENAKVWFYRDPAGNQQGPCSVAQFKLWITNMARDPSLAAQLEQFKSVDVWDNKSLGPVQLVTLLRPS